MQDITSKLRDLAPWHFDVDLGGVSTLEGNRAKFGNDPDRWPIGIVDPRELQPLLKHLYPEGLAGKTFLDVGCNGGGYCFLAKEMGAEYVLGFDAREHWINQARFVANLKGLQDIDFIVEGAHTFTASKRFDFTLFKGIFYHLADPVAALQRAAAATSEFIVVDTATDGARGELLMRFKPEDKGANLMTGVEAIAWWPSGADLICELLKRMGFPATREVYWKRKQTKSAAGGGRCRVVGARSEAMLAAFDASHGPVKLKSPKIKGAVVNSL